MKNILRTWLGINEDARNIATDINTLDERSKQQAVHTFELFHALPFVSGTVGLTAADAAKLTQPSGVQANSLWAVLTGIIIKARQGESQLQVEGELPADVRDALIKRKFKVEEHTGTGGTSTFILWV
jgi:hypothetical protein